MNKLLIKITNCDNDLTYMCFISNMNESKINECVSNIAGKLKWASTKWEIIENRSKIKK